MTLRHIHTRHRRIRPVPGGLFPCGVFVLIFAILAAWSAVGYVAYHFIAKAW